MKRRNDENDTQKKKRKWRPMPENALKPGSRGFLVSCERGRESRARSEAFQLLNECIRQEEKELTAEEELDMLRNTKYTFNAVDINVDCMLFIEYSDTKVKAPVELVAEIFEKRLSLPNEKRRCTKFITRFMPVQATCYANLSDIKAAAEKLVKEQLNDLPGDFNGTFCLVYRHRHDTGKLEREELTKEMASLVCATSESRLKVDLKSPDLVLLIEVIRNVALLSLTKDFNRFKKYNLEQIYLSKN